MPPPSPPPPHRPVGDPALTAQVVGLVELLAGRARLPKAAVLEAVGLTPRSFQRFRRGETTIRTRRGSVIKARLMVLQDEMDEGVCERLRAEPHEYRREAFDDWCPSMGTLDEWASVEHGA